MNETGSVIGYLSSIERNQMARRIGEDYSHEVARMIEGGRERDLAEIIGKVRGFTDDYFECIDRNSPAIIAACLTSYALVDPQDQLDAMGIMQNVRAERPPTPVPPRLSRKRPRSEEMESGEEEDIPQGLKNRAQVFRGGVIRQGFTRSFILDRLIKDNWVDLTQKQLAEKLTATFHFSLSTSDISKAWKGSKIEGHRADRWPKNNVARTQTTEDRIRALIQAVGIEQSALDGLLELEEPNRAHEPAATPPHLAEESD